MHIIEVDAARTSSFREQKGTGGIPGPVADHSDFPDMIPLWREAGITLVRSYDWLSRLDTRDNPESLFPDWSADPTDPSSYNFGSTDQWVKAVHAMGADVLFTFASSIPQNKVPAPDVSKYETVVEHIVRHYAKGWADGPMKPVRMFEFGDQPDLGPLHFAGAPGKFYEMYEAFARAVKRVDPLLQTGGPSLAFPLNPDAPYREDFIAYVRERELPLDFFSFLWFADATRDPMDFGFVAGQLRKLLDTNGFHDTKLMLSYWNYLAIPTNDAPAREKAAFQATSAIYLQDTPIDYALFFRGDSGKDPHYNFTDPAAIYNRYGNPDERAAAFEMIGKAMSGGRLATSGSDASGFACIASTDDQCIRILISNFVAPEAALEPRQSDDFTFRIPLGEDRIELSFQLPPQRSHLASQDFDRALVKLHNLPCEERSISMTTRSTTDPLVRTDTLTRAENDIFKFEINVQPQSVVMIELAPHADTTPS